MPNNLALRHISANKQPPRLRSIEGASPRKLALLQNQGYVRALTLGLGNNVLHGFLPVFCKGRNDSYVQLICLGRRQKVHGFSSLAFVHYSLSEENGAILMKFFASSRAMARNETPIKICVVSRFIGSTRSWVPLQHIEIIDTSASNSAQFTRINNEKLRRFVFDDVEDGSHFDLLPRKVGSGGGFEVTVNLNPVKISGYHENMGNLLYGRIFRRGDKKIVYFWANAARTGDPIKKEGNVFAKKTHGKWQLYDRAEDISYQRRMDTLAYEKYLFSCSARIHEETWQIYVDGKHPIAYKNIGGKTLKAHLGNLPQDVKEVYSVARLLSGKFKLVEFWPTKEAYERHEPPIASRFIAFKLKKGQSEVFWARLTDYKKFDELIESKELSPEELAALLSDEYYLQHHRSEREQLLAHYFPTPPKTNVEFVKTEVTTDTLPLQIGDDKKPLPATPAEWEKVLHNIGLVKYIANDYLGRGVDFEDLVQEGTIGLLCAVQSKEFDPSIGDFKYYAGRIIRNAMLAATKYGSNLVRSRRASTVYLEDDKGDYANVGDFIADKSSPNPERIASVGISKTALTQLAKRALPPRKYFVIQHRMGLDGEAPKTLEEVGLIMHPPLTRENVRKIEASALSTIRGSKEFSQFYLDDFEEAA